MIKAIQIKQRILIVPLALSFAEVLLLCSVAPAQQITPSPTNPPVNTITVSGTNTNDENFDNQGTIEIETSGTLTNNSGISNNGTIKNWGKDVFPEKTIRYLKRTCL